MRHQNPAILVQDGVVSVEYSSRYADEDAALEKIQAWSRGEDFAANVDRVLLFKVLSSIDGPIRLVITDDPEWFAEVSPKGSVWSTEIEVGDKDAVLRCSDEETAFVFRGTANHRVRITAAVESNAESPVLALLVSR